MKMTVEPGPEISSACWFAAIAGRDDHAVGEPAAVRLLDPLGEVVAASNAKSAPRDFATSRR